jgi:hypothetical protein
MSAHLNGKWRKDGTSWAFIVKVDACNANGREVSVINARKHHRIVVLLHVKNKSDVNCIKQYGDAYILTID